MVDFSESKDLAVSLRNLDLIEAFGSAVQDIKLFRHPLLGKVLIIDNEVQHIENWQPLYHEPLVHVPAAFVRDIETVLILGGGSLFAAAEALRYPSVERCVLVDHDRSVLALMARHYEHVDKVLSDKRFEHISYDAIEFMRQTDQRFDLVINDCFDAVSISRKTRESVFQLMTQKTTSTGVCSDLIYRHLFESSYISATRQALELHRPYGLSLISVPEYPGVLHVLAFWGPSVSQDCRLPHNNVQRSWCEGGIPKELRFFNPAFLAFHLYIPPYLKRIWIGSSDESATEAKLV